MITTIRRYDRSRAKSLPNSSPPLRDNVVESALAVQQGECRSVSKTNTFQLHKILFEAPVDLRNERGQADDILPMEQSTWPVANISSLPMWPPHATGKFPDSTDARYARKLIGAASTSGAGLSVSSAGVKAWAVCARLATEDYPASPCTPNSSPPPIICCA